VPDGQENGVQFQPRAMGAPALLEVLRSVVVLRKQGRQRCSGDGQ
jgi:hypothetical protein